jgi:hypothetical protein
MLSLGNSVCGARQAMPTPKYSLANLFNHLKKNDCKTKISIF